MSDLITNSVNAAINAISHIFQPVSQSTAIIKNSQGQSVLVPLGQTTTSYSGGGITPGGNVPTPINPSQYGFQQTIPTPPSQLTPIQFGGNSAYWGGGGAASFLSGAAPATSTILGETAPATSTILGGTAPIQAVQSQAGNQAAVQQYLASQGLNVSASTASTIGALSRFDTGTTQNYIPQNSNYNAPTGNKKSLSFLDKFTSSNATANNTALPTQTNQIVPLIKQPNIISKQTFNPFLPEFYLASKSGINELVNSKIKNQPQPNQFGGYSPVNATTGQLKPVSVPPRLASLTAGFGLGTILSPTINAIKNLPNLISRIEESPAIKNLPNLISRFTSGVSDVANSPLYENVIPGTNIPYGTSSMNLPGSIPVQKLPTSSSRLNDLANSINKQIDTLNKNYNSSIQGGNFTGSEAQYQNYLKDIANITSTQAKYVDLQVRSNQPVNAAADIGKDVVNFFTPTTVGEQVGKAALITTVVALPYIAPEILAVPLVQSILQGVNLAFTGANLANAFNPNLTAAQRLEAEAMGIGGLWGTGSFAKTILTPVEATPSISEIPQIRFEAQVQHLPSGNQQVGLISGSTLGKDNILSASQEIVSPSGISLGGGYSMQTINKETTFSKYLTGGSSQELGQANLIRPGEIATQSIPIEGQATLSNSVINEIAKVNLKGEALTPDKISSQKILAIFNENLDGSFNVVGTTKPLLKINKATGEVSYVARNLNIRGEVIQFQDLQGNSIAVKIGDLSKPVQESILNQVSASAIAKNYPPVNIPSPSASAALYRVPSYLGGGFSTNPQVSTATLSPSFISPTLTGGMTIENQNQQIAPSQVNTFVNLNNPNQNQPTITRAGTLTNLNTNQAQLQPSNLLNPSAQATSTSQAQASATKTPQTLAPKTMTRESQIQPEVSATAQQESFISKDSLLNPEVTKKVSNNPNPTTLLNLNSLIPKQKIIVKKAISKYKAYTKRFGKEVYLGESQSVQGAEKLGIENTLSTLSRSVIVKNEQNQQVPLFNPNTSLFRPSKSKKNPFTLIEINPLGAKSEVREIKSYQKPSNRPEQVEIASYKRQSNRLSPIRQSKPKPYKQPSFKQSSFSKPNKSRLQKARL